MQVRTVSRVQASAWARQSRAQGKDIGEIMDRAGVLLTPERLRAIRAIVINQIAQTLEETPAHQLAGTTNLNVPDFQAHLARSLRELANKEEQ